MAGYSDVRAVMLLNYGVLVWVVNGGIWTQSRSNADNRRQKSLGESVARESNTPDPAVNWQSDRTTGRNLTVTYTIIRRAWS